MNNGSTFRDELSAKLDDILALLRLLGRDGLAGLRLIGKEHLRAQLPKMLRTERDRRIYELTNGRNSTSQIAKEVRVSQPTIVNIWNRWKKAGIVEEVPKIQGRCRHICSLSDLDIPIEDSRKAGQEHEAGS